MHTGPMRVGLQIEGPDVTAQTEWEAGEKGPTCPSGKEFYLDQTFFRATRNLSKDLNEQ